MKTLFRTVSVLLFITTISSTAFAIPSVSVTQLDTYTELCGDEACHN